MEYIQQGRKLVLENTEVFEHHGLFKANNDLKFK